MQPLLQDPVPEGATGLHLSLGSVDRSLNSKYFALCRTGLPTLLLGSGDQVFDTEEMR